MSENDKNNGKGSAIAQDGYSGGVYSPEGYRPIAARKDHQSTAGHQPVPDQVPDVISIKTQPKNPPQGR